RRAFGGAFGPHRSRAFGRPVGGRAGPARAAPLAVAARAGVPVMRPLRKRLLIGLAAVLALNAAVYLAFTLPQSLRQRNLGARLPAAREEVEREKQRQQSLKARFDLVTANARDTSEFYQRRIGSRGTAMVPLLREVEGLARSNGLRVGGQTFNYEPLKGAP